MFKRDAGAQGYDDEALVDVVLAKSAALADQDILALPASAGLDRTLLAISVAALGRQPPIHVLDFGGAFGLHHRVARLGLPDVQLRWAIVETPLTSKKAEKLATDSLRWFPEIGSAVDWLGRVDLVHSIGAIQYMQRPEEALDRLCALEAPVMLWSKLALTTGDRRHYVQTSRLSENGPGPLPAAFSDREIRHAVTEISRERFLSAHRHYRLAWTFVDAFPGFLFRR
jgi:putative methyltransferase (TIGR04325 family)